MNQLKTFLTLLECETINMVMSNRRQVSRGFISIFFFFYFCDTFCALEAEFVFCLTAYQPVGYLMPQILDCLFFYVGFRAWVFFIVFGYIWSDFNEKVDLFLVNSRCLLGWYFWKGPLSSLSGRILGEFVWNCHT